MPQLPAHARKSRCNLSRVHHRGPAWLPAEFLAVCMPHRMPMIRTLIRVYFVAWTGTASSTGN
jgi:hypothetical protein